MKSQAHIFYFIISYFSTVLKTEGETICPALPIIRLWNPVRRNDIYSVQVHFASQGTSSGP